MNPEVEVNDHSEEVLDAIKRKTRAVLEAMGATCVGYAIDEVPVDTGRLKNSITWALSGEEASTKDYGPDNGTKDGHYSGTAPQDGDLSVYIGTNVSYAKDVEFGNGRQQAHPYLRPAVNGHMSELNEMIKRVFGS